MNIPGEANVVLLVPLQAQHLPLQFHCRMDSRSLQFCRASWLKWTRSFSLKVLRTAHLTLRSKGLWACKVATRHGGSMEALAPWSPSMHTPSLAQAEVAPPLKIDNARHHRWGKAPIYDVQIWTATNHMQSGQA